MKTPWNVIESPKLSEKAMKQKDRNVYVFVVDKSATKPEIKTSIEKIYGVKVDEVRTAIIKGKTKMMRNWRLKGRRKDVKKAYVSLKEGSRLDII